MNLQFGVFRAKGHQLKYIGNESTHTYGTLRVIPSGELNFLAKLIQHEPSFKFARVENVYPDHANALQNTGLAPPIFPTMGEL